MMLPEQEMVLVKCVLKTVKQVGLEQAVDYFSRFEQNQQKRLNLRNVKRQARRQQRKWKKNQL